MGKEKNQIKAEKITKPIQLLASWLIGLILINSTFLSAAVYIGTSYWTHSLLIVASVVNVPIFLLSIFILQTKFRPELQEDSYYSEYIMNQKGETVEIRKPGHQKDETLCSSQDIKISLNDYHPMYKKIRDHLKSEGFKSFDTFGRCSSVDHPPIKWAISISDKIVSEDLIPLLMSLKDFWGSFEGFRISSMYEEIETSDVYIGAYGDILNSDLTPLTEDKISALK